MFSHTARIASGDEIEQPSGTGKSLGTDITTALTEAGYRSLRSIQATVRHGTVYLTGTVETWYLKQVAQEVVMRIVGPGRVKNELSVVQGKAR